MRDQTIIRAVTAMLAIKNILADIVCLGDFKLKESRIADVGQLLKYRDTLDKCIDTIVHKPDLIKDDYIFLDNKLCDCLKVVNGYIDMLMSHNNDITADLNTIQKIIEVKNSLINNIKDIKEVIKNGF